MNGFFPDLVAIGSAFVGGLLARAIGLPPLVGYLITGFILYVAGARMTPVLREFADIGVTLLLFTIGLKLQLRNLLMPAIWGVASLHMMLLVALGSAFLLLSGFLGISRFIGLSAEVIALVAFALSFSSTVFAVKVLEEKGETASLYARIAIGILIMQDIAAVAFIATSTGKIPSIWALSLLLLIPLRPWLQRLLESAGRGELQILFGLTLALGGAWVFEQLDVKGDFGALVLGALLAGHDRSSDLARQLMSFKDLFLVGFFLSIGLSAPLTLDDMAIGLLLMLLIPFKTLLYFILFLAFRLRVRTAFLATTSLANFSEFGLIVATIGVQQGLIEANWLVVIAIAVSLSFILAAPLNALAYNHYPRWRRRLQHLESPRHIPEEADIAPGDARVIVFGMGRVGTGAYDTLHDKRGAPVLGVDVDDRVVTTHQQAGRNVIRGSATDPDFWDRIRLDAGQVELILLALPNVHENGFATQELRKAGFDGRIAATAKYDEDIQRLTEAGADAVFNLYTEAGSGFAESVCRELADHTRACG